MTEQSTAPIRPTDAVPASAGLRLLAVHAHPDDESSKGAAMMAAYAQAGAEVMVVTCTGGEAGDLLNPSYENVVATDRDITAVRREEMAEAVRALGIQHSWLGFLDSGLPEGDPLPALPANCFAEIPLRTAAAPLVALVRRFRPHVLIAYDEAGGYPHPDHIQAHHVAVEAYRAAGDPDAYPETGPAWEVSKLYYDRAFNPEKFRSLHEAFIAAGDESPFEARLSMYAQMDALREARRRQEAGEDVPDPEDAPGWIIPDHAVTTQVPVADFLEHRDAALRAHRTQVDPVGFFFAAPNELLRTSWPWEDYALIDARVPVELPEHDLFAGLR
ncbi:mycothiol conjugate amidase Mca [Micrococcus endophyticus]|uniref:Mycothiol S-conjugate amidase n=1 Tax=Micrococcus endophyticus TaxID=455343 RepID=A0A7W9N0A6_9MICC|nr:mycothiol S-conjugate amidase [Micrococcus endophyticus]MCK6091006.1 mycothiol conjugate amidase Mca [Micrococcus endophyticus]QCP08656.1 mycothiol conjugate amidase Mca [Micrococcus luteus]